MLKIYIQIITLFLLIRDLNIHKYKINKYVLIFIYIINKNDIINNLA